MMLLLAGRFRLRAPVAVLAVLAMLHATLLPAMAQQPRADDAPHFSGKQLEQLLAPIALYPDALLTHVLMASSYPLQIVQLARWQEQNPGLKGRDLEEAVADQSWDESVKALAPFAQVVRMMNDKLDWTQQVGEAFLAQEEDVFAAVQRLRDRAEAAGNLKTTKEMRVSRAPVEGRSYTVIEPVVVEEVYVPVYDPVVVYGAWSYPDYPPYYWYPRGWRRSDALFWFGAAVVAGAALWAVWDWRRRSLAVNPVRYNAFFRRNAVNPVWKFNPAARKGVPFKAPVLTKKFGPIAQPTALQKAQLKKRLPGTALPKSSFVPPHAPKGLPTAKSTKEAIKTPVPATTLKSPAAGTVSTPLSKTGKPLVKKAEPLTHSKPATIAKPPVISKPAVSKPSTISKPMHKTVKTPIVRTKPQISKPTTSRPVVRKQPVVKKPVPKAPPRKAGAH